MSSKSNEVAELGSVDVVLLVALKSPSLTHDIMRGCINTDLKMFALELWIRVLCIQAAHLQSACYSMLLFPYCELLVHATHVK